MYIYIYIHTCIDVSKSKRSLSSNILLLEVASPPCPFTCQVSENLPLVVPASEITGFLGANRFCGIETYCNNSAILDGFKCGNICNMYIYTHIYIYIYPHVYIYMYIYIYVCMYVSYVYIMYISIRLYKRGFKYLLASSSHSCGVNPATIHG